MSEDIEKEAQDAELNQEELDKVSGGYTEYNRGALFKIRFIFTEQEVQTIQKILKVSLEAGRGYKANELEDFGIGEGTSASVRSFLGSLGIFKS